MVPMGYGNDAGGSIRFPASCCGLFGLKPTRARLPLGPEYGDIFSGLAVEHALTRSVRDSAALLDATAGPDLGDPYLAPAPERPFLEEVGADPGRLRIAFCPGPFGPDGIHPDCAAAVHDAAALCESLGHDVSEALPTGCSCVPSSARRSAPSTAAPSRGSSTTGSTSSAASPPTTSSSRSRASTGTPAAPSAPASTCSASRSSSAQAARSRGSSPTTTCG